MGQFVLTINYADDKEDDILNALRAQFGKITAEGPQGQPIGDRELTPAEVRDRLELMVTKLVRKAVKNHKLLTIDDSIE